jgi:alpha 1,3-glucosidase
LYGIPEHTSPLSLPTTRAGSAGLSPKYNEPYRLYNLDVFEYELDETMALYGHIPFMTAHGLVDGIGQSAGVFWFNPSETFIDISDSSTVPLSIRNSPASSKIVSSVYKESHWLSESGQIDFFLFPGPTPKEVFAQFTTFSGRQQLPPLFALGYHQCRWNYRDERDVAAVEGMFEELDYPMDGEHILFKYIFKQNHS